MATLIFLFIVIFSLCIGFIIYRFPYHVFEIQRKFYTLINWRIEPISMQKEIRNTRIMGLFLMLFVIASCFYYFLR